MGRPPAASRTSAGYGQSAAIRRGRGVTGARRDHGLRTGRLDARPQPRRPRPLGGRHRPEPGRVPPARPGLRRRSPSPASASTATSCVEAGIERADAFAAVSSGDNSNIISARLARETFGVTRVVARIYDQKRAEVYERLGIPTVATVRWTADRMIRHLVPEGHVEIWRDPTSTVSHHRGAGARGLDRPTAAHAGGGGRRPHRLPDAVRHRHAAHRVDRDPGRRPALHAGHRRHRHRSVTEVAGAAPEGGH